MGDDLHMAVQGIIAFRESDKFDVWSVGGGRYSAVATVDDGARGDRNGVGVGCFNVSLGQICGIGPVTRCLPGSRRVGGNRVKQRSRTCFARMPLVPRRVVHYFARVPFVPRRTLIEDGRRNVTCVIGRLEVTGAMPHLTLPFSMHVKCCPRGFLNFVRSRA